MYDSGNISNTLLLIVYMSFLLLIPKIGLAFIPANIAKKKGSSFGGFYALGIFWFLLSLILALCFKDKNAPAKEYKVDFVTNPLAAQEIEKYHNLYKQGIITEEEFNLKKNELLK